MNLGWPSDFYLDDPNNSLPEKLIFNPKYWDDMVRAYSGVFDGEPLNSNHHVLFYQFFRNKIIDALYDLNGQLGNREDYAYYADLVINTQDLANESPWKVELGLVKIDPNSGAEILIFNLDNEKL